MPQVDAAAALREMILGFRLTQLLAVAARLGVADQLAAGPQAVHALADAVGADAHALRRVLRALASEGIFAETDDGRFENTALAELLRDDVPASLRGVAMLYGEPWMWQAYSRLLDTVRTGVPAFELVHGQGLYPFLQRHAAPAETFQRAMTGYTMHEVAAIAAVCDLGTARTVVDVGGGHGALVAALLARDPQLQGIVFDRPDVIPAARRALDASGLTPRCTCVAGDFFEAVPVGGDVYLMKSVLHNWGDDAALSILRTCRRAMEPGSRLLVAERVVAKGNGRCEAKLFDINMMVSAGGQERTHDEYRELLGAAGMRLERVVATASPISLIEATVR